MLLLLGDPTSQSTVIFLPILLSDWWSLLSLWNKLGLMGNLWTEQGRKKRCRRLGQGWGNSDSAIVTRKQPQLGRDHSAKMIYHLAVQHCNIIVRIYIYIFFIYFFFFKKHQTSMTPCLPRVTEVRGPLHSIYSPLSGSRRKRKTGRTVQFTWGKKELIFAKQVCFCQSWITVEIWLVEGVFTEEK